jgi:predicted PurR-regulated permease PerM
LLIEITLSVIAAVFSGNPGLQVPLLIALYLLQNLLETSYLVPKIVGERIGLHPALLILSLLVFSYFFGFIGLLIALPVTSIILMFFKEWLAKRDAHETIEVIEVAKIAEKENE